MKKLKNIETDELIIKGNFMSWKETMIQLSNVSFISTAMAELMDFSIWSIVLILAGVFITKYILLLGTAFIVGGIVWILVWYRVNETRKKDTILNITMNSGTSFQIVFRHRFFLDDVLQVLEQILIEGGVGESNNVSININGCQISGNASVLNDFKSSRDRYFKDYKK